MGKAYNKVLKSRRAKGARLSTALNAQSSMWLKTEMVGLLIGLVAVVFELITIFFWSGFPEAFHKQFYGGAPGAMLVGLGIIVGLISSILYLANLVCKRGRLWWLRLLGFMALYLGFAIIGATGI